MTIDEFLYCGNTFYTEYSTVPPGQIGIDRFLFNQPPSVDASNGGVRIQDYVDTPHALYYKAEGSQSRIIPIESGKEDVYILGSIDYLTPFDDKLKDFNFAGLEANSSGAAQLAVHLRRTIERHEKRMLVTRWRQALDVMFEGVFKARAENNVNVADINFNRKLTNSYTNDFSTTKIDEAISDAIQVYADEQGYLSNLVLLCGSKWLKEFAKDSLVKEKRKYNDRNVLVEQGMRASMLNNTHGLRVHASYTADTAVEPVFICSFSPSIPYRSSENAAITPWIPDDEAILFSMDSSRVPVFRRIAKLSDSSSDMIEDVASENLVFDGYVEKNPVRQVIRSQSRHLYLPLNINHTVRVKGTNFTP